LSRKFNIGRQGDMLLNEKLHKLLSALEFIPYRNDKNELTAEPKQTRQTPIPYGALWLEHPGESNVHKLRVHADRDAETIDGQWPCVFEGYYHPAMVTELPKNPVHGQLWLDANNVLRVYDQITADGQWKIVLAGQAPEVSGSMFTGLDFQIIDPLLEVQGEHSASIAINYVAYDELNERLMLDVDSYSHYEDDEKLETFDHMIQADYDPIEEMLTLSTVDNTTSYGFYAVPFEPYGKFFAARENEDPYRYCHPIVGYKEGDSLPVPGYVPETVESAISVTKGTEEYEALSWVHVNPLDLKKVTKRLIKINKSESVYKGFIGVPAGRTEFYGISAGEKIGRLLKRYTSRLHVVDNKVTTSDIVEGGSRNDYKVDSGGIRLSEKAMEEFDYVYAISYDFNQDHTYDGNLVRTTVNNISGQNDIYIGPCTGDPVVFMDGLYLERYKDDGVTAFYKYDDNKLTFESDSVLDEMQLLVIAFPQVNREYKDGPILEYSISESDIVDGSAFIRGLSGTVFDQASFTNPIFFYNGLAGYTYVANEVEIDYNEKSIKICDFAVDKTNGNSTVFAVSLGDKAYVNHGTLEDGKIIDEAIDINKNYLVIVEGIVMSPFSEDITVASGMITVTDALMSKDAEYTLIEMVDNGYDTECITCVYDDIASTCSIAIRDHNQINTNNIYNDCDTAVVMCGPGVLVDRDAIRRPFDASDYYIGGQIVQERIMNEYGEELFEWRMFDYTNQYIVLDKNNEEHKQMIEECESMMTYYANKGSIQIEPIGLEDNAVTVYSYTYVDAIDEKQISGNREIPIYIQDHVEEESKKHMFVTNRTHLYDTQSGALSTYVNGIMTPNEEKNIADNQSDKFLMDKQITSSFRSYAYDHASYVDMGRVLLEEIQDDTVLSDVRQYFNSEQQLNSAKKLSKYIKNELMKENLFYIIENTEKNEFMSCSRQWNLPRNENNDNLPNSYMTRLKLSPGTINVYVNGVLLNKDEYMFFDNNKVMINFDLVGGQDLSGQNLEGMNHPYRVITDKGFVYIDCEGNDEVTIEVRDDTALKKVSYEIKEHSYETQSFTVDDYEFSKSLQETKDLIKIYINGVIYDGPYSNIKGTIKLLEPNFLTIDPMYTYFITHPFIYNEYKKEHGEYVRKKDIITFEWR
jgi:hypothetical protein